MTDNPTRVILPGPSEVVSETADTIMEIGEEVFKERQEFRLVLSGGSTPRRLYDILTESPFRGLPWNRVHFFWGDERCVGPDHPDSNYRMAREAFLKNLDIPEKNIHRLKGEAADAGAAARDYEEEMRGHFGLSVGSPPPSFDLVLLGMGADGHTASLFPETQALKETVRWVVANPVPRLATYRLTLTPVILNRATWVIFLVTGADKAETLAEVLEGPFNPERFPAQMIQPRGGRLLWFLDKAAASRLKTV